MYHGTNHLRQNVDAIKLALKLDKEKQQATPQGREILSLYSGFGGIKAILNPDTNPKTSNGGLNPKLSFFRWCRNFTRYRENSETLEEYKRYVKLPESLYSDRIFTPKPVIDALANALQDSSITLIQFLEPSAGTDAFISSFKEIAPEAEVTGFEKDLLTGKILSHLYPQDKVRIEGYEKMEGRYAQHFDVIASNIPFGGVAVFDPLLSNHEIPAVKQSAQAIRNYFFTKSCRSERTE